LRDSIFSSSALSDMRHSLSGIPTANVAGILVAAGSARNAGEAQNASALALTCIGRKQALL